MGDDPRMEDWPRFRPFLFLFFALFLGYMQRDQRWKKWKMPGEGRFLRRPYSVFSLLRLPVGGPLERGARSILVLENSNKVGATVILTREPMMFHGQTQNSVRLLLIELVDVVHPLVLTY